MDSKKKDRAIMAITIAAVAGIMAVMVWIIYSYTHGNMDENIMMAACSMMSGALMVVVVLFGIYVYKAPSASEQYRRMLEEKEKKGERAPSSGFTGWTSRARACCSTPRRRPSRRPS